MIPHTHAPLRWFDDVAQAVVNGPEFIIFAVCATSEQCSQLIDWLSAVLPGMTGCAVSVSPGTAIQKSVILCPLRQLIHYRDEVSCNLYGDRKHSAKECHFPVDHLNKVLKEHYQCRAVVFVSSDEQMASFAKEAPNLIEMSAFMRVQADLPALEPGNPLVPAYQAELKRYEEAYGLSTPEFMRHLYELQDLPEALTESAIRAWQNVANILRNIDRQPQGESQVTKDEKATPQQQQKEQADSKEKAAGSSGVSDFFASSAVQSRKVLQVVDKLLVFSRKWPRVQRALLSAVENLEFSIEMTKKSAELVSEFVSGSDTEQAKKEIAAVEVHTNDRFRARYTVSDEVVRSHPTWLMRCFNGGGKHLVISSEEMMHLDPETRVRPLGSSWRNLAPIHNQEQGWRFLSDVNDGTFLWDQRWQTRMNPEQECHISAEGEFIGRASWNPKIQIRPIGATWEQVEEKERCRPKAKTPGVN